MTLHRMSEHGHAGTSEAHGDHHYQYDGKPTDEAPGEPVTPGWLTLLGITLVLAALLGLAAMRPDAKTRAELAPPAPSGGGAPAAAPAQPNPAARPPVRPLASGFHPTPSMVPSAFFARPGASGLPRPIRPPGTFAVQPGSTAGGSGVAPPPPRRPPPAVPQ
jgi:hypothetical protein